jgi:hypothetical protein
MLTPASLLGLILRGTPLDLSLGSFDPARLGCYCLVTEAGQRACQHSARPTRRPWRPPQARPGGARAATFSLTPAKAEAGSRSKARVSGRDEIATPAWRSAQQLADACPRLDPLRSALEDSIRRPYGGRRRPKATSQAGAHQSRNPKAAHGLSKGRSRRPSALCDRRWSTWVVAETLEVALAGALSPREFSQLRV